MLGAAVVLIFVVVMLVVSFRGVPLRTNYMKVPCFLRVPALQEMIPKMIEAGTNIFRLNCSHRRGGDFERVYPLIRKYAKDASEG